MADLSTLLRAPVREMRIEGTLTFADGAELALDGGDILQVTVEEGADGALLPGNVLSSTLTLELANGEGQFSPGGARLGGRALCGATLALFLCALDGEDWRRGPLGVFVVNAATRVEAEARVRLKCEDSAASELSGTFVDGLSYPATLDDIWTHIVSQTRYLFSGGIPNGAGIVDAAPDWGGASLRSALGAVAAAAGCYVLIDRSGALRIQALNDDRAVYAIDTADYLKLERDAGGFGPVDALMIAPAGAEAGETCFYATAAQTALCPLRMGGNPLFQAGAAHFSALGQAAAAAVAGYALMGARFDWRGDPALCVGMRVRLTDTDGDALTLRITRQTLRYGGGFSASCVCAVPESDNGGVLRAITPEGGVNAAALVGTVDGGKIAAHSVTAIQLSAASVNAEKLCAGSVTATTIAAGAVNATKIAAGAVETDKLAAGAVDAGKIAANAIVADKIAAGAVTTEKLAAFCVSAGNIAAGAITADSAIIADGAINTAKIALGAITTALIQTGAVDTAQIKDGSITDAKIVSLNADVITSGTLATDRLILTGADGLIYEINATSSGLTAAQLTNEQYKHQINGTVIVARSLTADQIAAAAITANEIAAGAITTEKIAAQAVDASKIKAGSITTDQVAANFGQTLNISSNTAIRSVVESVDNMQTTITQTRAAIGLCAGETYTDPDSLIARTQRAEQWITPRNILMVVDDGNSQSHLQLDNSGLYVNGGTFGINVSGSAGDTTFDEQGLTVPVINSPSAVRRYYGPATITVYAAADDAQLRNGTQYRSVSDAFAAISDCQIDSDISIYIEGTFYEDPLLTGTFGGGKISVMGGTIVGETYIRGCSNHVIVSQTAFTSKYSGADNGYELRVDSCHKVELLACSFSGACQCSIFSQYSSMSVYNTSFDGSTYASLYGYSPLMEFTSNKGVCTYASYCGDRSFAIMSGTRPSGAITDQRNGAQLFGEAAIDTGGAAPTPPPVATNTTQTFACTASNTYRGGWRGSGDIWQGYSGGRNYGCYWFSGLEAAISGRTIVSATLNLRRMTGYGAGAGATLNVYACGNAAAGGAISVLSGGSAGSIKQGEQKTVTISNAALQAIASGSGHGLVLDTGETSAVSGKSYSAGYARLNGVGSSYVPVLTVTYQ